MEHRPEFVEHGGETFRAWSVAPLQAGLNVFATRGGLDCGRGLVGIIGGLDRVRAGVSFLMPARFGI